MPHIAICGAGISGLTLAAILCRGLSGRAHITVFERACADRDQGYGPDLDDHGQEALTRAGVYHWADCPVRGACRQQSRKPIYPNVRKLLESGEGA